ncbi:MAG: hypothetical protein IKP69_01385 [Oscillospiraceae bacterium]|nr:hypothetical protein [Oscillospiraceae bacterium]
MLTLIYDYELTRSQLLKRIYELNQQLHSASLPAVEREALTARCNALRKEQAELLEIILEMKSHLEKEELNNVQTHPCSGIRS